MTRRDNGLHATAYVRLADVETHVVDGLLERLRDEQVAAYVAPTAGQRGPYGDTVLPGTPSDSVYVDTLRQEQARHVVDRYLGEIREELAWASIVAAYDEPTVDSMPRWPASEDVESARSEEEPEPGRVVRPALGFPDATDIIASGPDETVADANNDADEHFRPPPPPPVPMPDVVGRFAWAGVLGGPLFLVVGTVLGIDISGWPGLIAFAAFVGGFVTLVARMKDRPPTDSGYDDGAVV